MITFMYKHSENTMVTHVTITLTKVYFSNNDNARISKIVNPTFPKKGTYSRGTLKCQI